MQNQSADGDPNHKHPNPNRKATATTPCAGRAIPSLALLVSVSPVSPLLRSPPEVSPTSPSVVLGDGDGRPFSFQIIREGTGTDMLLGFSSKRE